MKVVLMNRYTYIEMQYICFWSEMLAWEHLYKSRDLSILLFIQQIEISKWWRKKNKAAPSN